MKKSILYILYILLNLNLVLGFPYQIFRINYYNNTYCSNNSFKLDIYQDNCHGLLDYDDCCKKLLDDNSFESHQRLDICYRMNNTISYMYDCKYSGSFYAGGLNPTICAIIGITLLIFCIIASYYYCDKRKKMRKESENQKLID